MTLFDIFQSVQRTSLWGAVGPTQLTAARHRQEKKAKKRELKHVLVNFLKERCTVMDSRCSENYSYAGQAGVHLSNHFGFLIRGASNDKDYNVLRFVFG